MHLCRERVNLCERGSCSEPSAPFRHGPEYIGRSEKQLAREGHLFFRVAKSPASADIFSPGNREGSSDRGAPIQFHRNHTGAVGRARAGSHYGLTTGPDRARALAKSTLIVDHLVSVGSSSSITAVVYPIRALAKGQNIERR